MADCSCYEFTAQVTGVATYTDCDDVTQSISIIIGNVYNFCTTNINNFNGDSRLPTTTILLGGCVDGICIAPVTTTTTFPVTTTTTTIYVPVPNIPLEPTNECDVITIFPMGVECFTINPTNTETYDGIVSLVITGGTPPYEILWETGSIGTTITNLKVGEYSATITDSYGDFIINTTCELIAPPAPTTTTTTSTTTLPPFDDLCMIISIPRKNGYNTEFIDFIFNDYYNGKPSWLSSDNVLFMYWNTGTTNQWLVSGSTTNTLYNANPTTPPISGWVFLGPTEALVSVTQGSCDNLPPLTLQLSKNDSNCRENGSIIATASGGIPPYLYSLNNGITTQSSPIFQNLGAGTYSVTVIDSTNVTQTQNITIVQNGTNVNYVVTLNIVTNSSAKNFTVSVSPTLPAGTTISYDLIYETEFKRGPLPTTANQVITPTILVNTLAITNPSPLVVNSSTILPNSCNLFTTNTKYTWGGITMTTTTTVTGTITDVATPVLPIPASCYSINNVRNLTINNLKITGCECCSVTLKQSGTISSGLSNINFI